MRFSSGGSLPGGLGAGGISGLKLFAAKVTALGDVIPLIIRHFI